MVVQPTLFEDNRGSFQEIWKGVNTFFQVNQSVSNKGVLRGMHYQTPPQSKLVWVPHGEILDVLINLGTEEVSSFVISSEKRNALYVPHGYAHGFQVLSDIAVVCYVVDHPRNPNGENAIKWDSFGFDWPLDPILSDKDADATIWTSLK